MTPKSTHRLAAVIVILFQGALPLQAAVHAAENAKHDARGLVVRSGPTRMNYLPDAGGRGWQQVTLDPGGGIVTRAAVEVPRVLEAPRGDRLMAEPVQPVASSLAPEAAYEQPTLGWTSALFGSNIGEAGLQARDLEGDGAVEVVVGSSSSGGFGIDDIWRIMRKGSGGTYQDIWTSRWYGNGIVRIALGDADRDGVTEIYVGLPDGTIEIHDGGAPGSPATIATGLALKTMAVADADGDGNPDLVLTDGTLLICRGLAPPYAVKWSLPAAGGTGLAVGQVDNDAAPEIVVTQDGGSGPGLVIDGATRLVQWRYANGFGALVRCGDVDADGRDEIVAAAGWYKVTAFDVEIQSPKWEIPIDSDIGAMRLLDTDGDAVPEIIVGEGQWGSILCFDAATRAQRWTIANPEHGVTEVEIADVNADGALEVLWGAGATSTGPDYLFVADLAARRIDWQNVHLDGPLTAVGAGDLDGDGATEIAMISFSSESGYENGIINIFDGETHEKEWTGDSAPGGMDWMGVRSVEVGDVDADGRDEIVYTSASIYDGKIVVFDGAAHTIERASAGYNGNYFSALAIADVDGDGQVEIVAGQGREHTGATGVSIVVFDGATMAEEWRSVDLGIYWGYVSDIAIGDVDGDGHLEIVAAMPGGKIYVYDGTTHQLDWLADLAANSVEIADVDNDGAPEILLGRTSVVEAYNGVTHALESSRPVGTGAIVALRSAGASDGGRRLFASDGSRLLHFSWADPAVAWQSPVLGTRVAGYNHLVLADADDDGAPELLVGSNYALFEYDLGSGNPRVSSIVREDPDPASGASVGFTVTFSEPVTGVDQAPPFSDFALATTGVTGASISAVAGSGDTYTVSVQTGDGMGDGTIRLDLADDDSILDDDSHPLGGAGTGNGDFTGGEVYTIWGNPRVASVVRADPNPTSATSVVFAVTFSEPVTGVGLTPPFADFALTTTGVTTGTVSAVSGSGDTYMVTVSVNSHSGNGTIRLDIVDDDRIVDALGNPLGGAGSGNGNYTAGQRYAVLTIPRPLSPAGKIPTARPTYKWTSVPGATRYRYQLFKASTLVSTKVVSSAVCGDTTCANAATSSLAMGGHKWRVQAMLGGAWKSYSTYKTFTVAQKAGYWSGDGLEFYVTPDLASVDNFAIFISVTGCGSYKITYLPLVGITNSRFAFGGSFYASGIFSSPARVSGELGLSKFYIGGCGYVSGGPFPWTGAWRRPGQPTLASAVDSGPVSITTAPDTPAAVFEVEGAGP